jgi:hypothetical protein
MATNIGSVLKKPARIPITNIYMDGDYTGEVIVGSQGKIANVNLDTGSSTLAFDGQFYNPSQDTSAQLTNIAQEVIYGRGSWVGAVVSSDVCIGGTTVKEVNFAVAYVESKEMFGKANGIMGLAYTRLNSAFTLPGKTWPPKYHYNQIQNGSVTFVDPYFTQLEKSGIFANKFAFYTRRSKISHAKTNPSADPLNHGYLILGGGEESTDLYDSSKPFQIVRVLDDVWYNTNLKAIVVGSSDPITVPPPTKGSGNLTNSIIDSGTSSITLSQELFDAVIARLSSGDNKQFAHAMRAGYLPMGSLNRKLWPQLDFILEGVDGDVRIEVSPQNYWQVNSPERGYATAPLRGDGERLKGRSILGLPLMNGYFTIFDRSEDRTGVVKFSPRR